MSFYPDTSAPGVPSVYIFPPGFSRPGIFPGAFVPDGPAHHIFVPASAGPDGPVPFLSVPGVSAADIPAPPFRPSCGLRHPDNRTPGRICRFSPFRCSFCVPVTGDNRLRQAAFLVLNLHWTLSLSGTAQTAAFCFLPPAWPGVSQVSEPLPAPVCPNTLFCASGD